ncbi:glycosyltransferase [Paramicrobacterium fandaimingii]|uniref:glycosyltransferase n=1 Tax=Paramicrobacterium fandaimingii TaxID=2708079 RepID=UPI0014237944|nr:glycosyltransferase family 2 protein [Microbacterium fandaimingii]
MTLHLADAPDLNLFTGLPLYVQIFYWVVLTITLSSGLSVVVLIVNARRYGMAHDDTHSSNDVESDFLWIFMVPALNEEVTIADSVTRLRRTHVRHRMILVINDGSDDRTGEVLDSLAGPDLTVLTRVAPHARRGKAAALNNAFSYVRDVLLPSSEYAQWSADRVILGIVDADGRLSPNACQKLGPSFENPSVGGAQCLVRIYNRGHLLTWAQDIEFRSFGYVFQAGRAHWGTANMGGNGQFNRFSALAEVSDGDGPWRDRLTEDQDLGVRLVQQGWQGVQVNEATIEQQGLRSIRRLYRQRTRWAQGAWQALGLVPSVGRSRVTVLARVDCLFYLLTPALQLTTGIGFVSAVLLATMSDVALLPGNLLVALIFVSVGFGPGIATLLMSGRGPKNILYAAIAVLPYTVYSWLIFPVLVQSVIRQLSGRTAWAKTAREAIEAPHAEHASVATSEFS